MEINIGLDITDLLTQTQADTDRIMTVLDDNGNKYWIRHNGFNNASQFLTDSLESSE